MEEMLFDVRFIVVFLIKSKSCAKLNMGFLQTHYLSGPLRIVDAEGVPASPGDLLAVEICNLGPLPGDEWGYTGIFERENGGGFLTDHFPSARKAIWYFEGNYAHSPQIPGKSSCVNEAFQL